MGHADSDQDKDLEAGSEGWDTDDPDAGVSEGEAGHSRSVEGEEKIVVMGKAEVAVEGAPQSRMRLGTSMNVESANGATYRDEARMEQRAEEHGAEEIQQDGGSGRSGGGRTEEKSGKENERRKGLEPGGGTLHLYQGRKTVVGCAEEQADKTTQEEGAAERPTRTTVNGHGLSRGKSGILVQAVYPGMGRSGVLGASGTRGQAPLGLLARLEDHVVREFHRSGDNEVAFEIQKGRSSFRQCPELAQIESRTKKVGSVGNEETDRDLSINGEKGSTKDLVRRSVPSEQAVIRALPAGQNMSRRFWKTEEDEFAEEFGGKGRFAGRRTGSIPPGFTPSFAPRRRREMGNLMSEEEEYRWWQQQKARDDMVREVESRRRMEDTLRKKARIEEQCRQYSREGRFQESAWQEADEEFYEDRREVGGFMQEDVQECFQLPSMSERNRQGMRLVVSSPSDTSRRLVYETPVSRGRNENRTERNTSFSPSRPDRRASSTERGRRGGSLASSRGSSPPPPDALRHFVLSEAERGGEETQDEQEEVRAVAKTFDQLTESAQAPPRNSVITVTAVDLKGKVREMEAPEGTRWQGGWTESGGMRTPTLVVTDESLALKLGMQVGATVGIGKCKEAGLRWMSVEEKVLTTAAGRQKETPPGKEDEHAVGQDKWQTATGRGRGRGKGAGGEEKGKGGRKGAKGAVPQFRSPQFRSLCRAFSRGECKLGAECKFEHFRPELPGGAMHHATLAEERKWLRRATEKAGKRQAQWLTKPPAGQPKDAKELQEVQAGRQRMLQLYNDALGGVPGKMEELRRYKADRKGESEAGNGEPVATSGTTIGKKGATQTTAASTLGVPATPKVATAGNGEEESSEKKEGGKNAKNARHAADRAKLERAAELRREKEFGLAWTIASKLCDELGEGEGPDFLRARRAAFLARDPAAMGAGIKDLVQAAVATPGRITAVTMLLDKLGEGMAIKRGEGRVATELETEAVLALTAELRSPLVTRAVQLEALARVITEQAKVTSRECNVEWAKEQGITATQADMGIAGCHMIVWVEKLVSEVGKRTTEEEQKATVDRLMGEEKRREDRLLWAMLRLWADRCGVETGLQDAMARCDQKATEQETSEGKRGEVDDRELSGADTAGDSAEERPEPDGVAEVELDSKKHREMSDRVLGGLGDVMRVEEAIGAIQEKMPEPGQGAVAARDGKRAAEGRPLEDRDPGISRTGSNKGGRDTGGKEDTGNESGGWEKSRQGPDTGHEEAEDDAAAKIEVRHPEIGPTELHDELTVRLGGEARTCAQEGGGSYGYCTVDATKENLREISRLAETADTKYTVRLATIDRAENPGVGNMLFEGGLSSRRRAVLFAEEMREKGYMAWVSEAEISRVTTENPVYMLKGASEMARAVDEFPGRVTYAESRLRSMQRKRLRQDGVRAVGMEVWAPRGMTGETVRRFMERLPNVREFEFRLQNVTAVAETNDRRSGDRRWLFDMTGHWLVRLMLTNQRWPAPGGSVGIRVDPNDETEGVRMNRIKRSHPQLFLPSRGGGISSRLTEEGLAFITDEYRKGVPPGGTEESGSTLLQQVMEEVSPHLRRRAHAHTPASPTKWPSATPGMGSAARPQPEDRASVVGRAAVHQSPPRPMAATVSETARLPERPGQTQRDVRRASPSKATGRPSGGKEDEAMERQIAELTEELARAKEAKRRVEELKNQERARLAAEVAKDEAEQRARAEARAKKEQEAKERQERSRSQKERLSQLRAELMDLEAGMSEGDEGLGEEDKEERQEEPRPGIGSSGRDGWPQARREEEEDPVDEGEAGKGTLTDDADRQAAEIKELRRTLADLRGATAQNAGHMPNEAAADTDWGESSRNQDRWARPEGHRGWGEATARDPRGAGAAPGVVSEWLEATTGGKGSSDEDRSEETGRLEEAEQERPSRAEKFVKRHISARLGRFKAALNKSEAKSERRREEGETGRPRVEAGSSKAAGNARSSSTPRPAGNAPRARGDCTPGWGDDGEWYDQDAWADFWGGDDEESKDRDSAGSEASSERETARGRQTGRKGSRAKSQPSGRRRREEAPLVGETGEAVKAAKTKLLEHTQKEASVVRPSRRMPDEYARYEADRAQGAEKTAELQRRVKEALEANSQAQASPAASLKRSGQADLRSFLSPRAGSGQKAARELREEFAATAADEQGGESHGSSA